MGNSLYLDEWGGSSLEHLQQVLSELGAKADGQVADAAVREMFEAMRQAFSVMHVEAKESALQSLASSLSELEIDSIKSTVETPLVWAVQIAVEKRLHLAGMRQAAHGLLVPEKNSGEERICQLECNIDDATGEMLGLAMERLFQAGARDVRFVPVFMKKNRPAYELKVICTQDCVTQMEEVIFQNTTTIGIRRQSMERSVLERSTFQAETTLGTVQIKKCMYSNGPRYYPEYESIKSICEKMNMPYDEVYVRVKAEVLEQMK
ncbi:MAG: DUF111 family protein [Lachnospiraceae bacterium]|nr:DUF111 family protein [Lachnospiraceae bacterium]